METHGDGSFSPLAHHHHGDGCEQQHDYHLANDFLSDPPSTRPNILENQKKMLEICILAVTAIVANPAPY